jgi:hypothetical protein
LLMIGLFYDVFKVLAIAGFFINFVVIKESTIRV